MMKKRQQHLNKVLSSLNSESLPATMDGDVEMEDVQNSSFGFKKASTGGNDFSFMKRKVRVNAVDKDIKEYQLDQDEIDAKKQKGKKYL